MRTLPRISQQSDLPGMTTGDRENGTVTCSCPELEGDALKTLLPVMTGPSDATKDAFTGVPISTLAEAPPEPFERCAESGCEEPFQTTTTTRI